MKKNPGRAERRRLARQHKRAMGRDRVKLHSSFMKILARKRRKLLRHAKGNVCA